MAAAITGDSHPRIRCPKPKWPRVLRSVDKFLQGHLEYKGAETIAAACAHLRTEAQPGPYACYEVARFHVMLGRPNGESNCYLASKRELAYRCPDRGAPGLLMDSCQEALIIAGWSATLPHKVISHFGNGGNGNTAGYHLRASAHR